MSILKKTSLALAVVAAVGFSVTAMAYTVTGAPALPANIANVSVITTAGPTAGNVTFASPEVVSYNVESSDNILGRTTGISVRLTLQDGAKFLTAPSVAVGTADALWTAAITAGGATGDNYVVVSVSPPSPATNLTTGSLVKITLNDITASTLATAGNIVHGKFDIFDPVGGTTFDSQTLPLVTSNNALASTFVGGDTGSRIDVGTNTTYAISKTAFTPAGSSVIGSSNRLVFDAGTLTQKVATGVSYNFAPTDAFTTVVSMSTIGNFGTTGNNVFLAASSACAAPIVGTAVTYQIGANTVTIKYPASSLVGFAPATGGTAELCFQVDGTHTVSDSTVSASSSFVANVSGTTSNTASATALPLKYNGSVVKVPVFNPGGNTVQQSVLRLSNTSGLGGKVTITGTDDVGATAGPFTFNLGANSSKQINADVLANGATGFSGSLGTPTGKWRLTVTGEFNGLVVQSLMRNNSTGTFTNLSTSLVPGGVGQ